MMDTERFYRDVGQQIKTRREQLGLTQEALAAQVALTRTSITNIERGRQKLLLHTWMTIAAALGVEAVLLLPPPVEAARADLSKLKGAPVDKQAWVAWIQTTVDATPTEGQP